MTLEKTLELQVVFSIYLKKYINFFSSQSLPPKVDDDAGDDDDDDAGGDDADDFNRFLANLTNPHSFT